MAWMTLYVEECDCGDMVLHNNGGHYHQVVEVAYVEQLGVVIRHTDTRENFPGDKFDVLVRDRDGKFYLLYDAYGKDVIEKAGLRIVLESRENEMDVVNWDMLGQYEAIRDRLCVAYDELYPQVLTEDNVQDDELFVATATLERLRLL